MRTTLPHKQMAAPAPVHVPRPLQGHNYSLGSPDLLAWCDVSTGTTAASSVWSPDDGRPPQACERLQAQPARWLPGSSTRLANKQQTRVACSDPAAHRCSINQHKHTVTSHSCTLACEQLSDSPNKWPHPAQPRVLCCSSRVGPKPHSTNQKWSAYIVKHNLMVKGTSLPA
jgi:hypothetical protein